MSQPFRRPPVRCRSSKSHRTARQLGLCLCFAGLGGLSSGAGIAGGLSSTNSRLIYEVAANPLHPPAIDDELGYAVASGDFDGDGVDDLAIGLRSDDNPLAGLVDIGQVQIRFGAAGVGLDRLVLAKYLWQGGLSGVDDPEEGDHFGEALLSGDFDGDGFDDLAIGIPGEDVGTIVNAGAVEVRYGAANRFDALEIRRQLFHENISGVPDDAGIDDEFGSVLAGGDFDGDTFDDLAIGVPQDSASGVSDSGRVIVLYGAPGIGLGVGGASVLDEDTPGIPNSPGTLHRFGHGLAAADFDHDGDFDLAVSSTGWNTFRGTVYVVPGGSGGLTGAGSQAFVQGAGGLAGTPTAGDYFGKSLAGANFNGDLFADLAIGIPGELAPSGPAVAAGGVQVLFGSASGLVGSGSQLWTPLTPGVPGEPEANDLFGWSIAAGDFDHDGFDELAIGVPYEQTFLGPFEGDVVVLPGSPAGPVGDGAVAWNLQVPGILGDMNPDDRLGWSLAVGDFDGNLHADLVIGIPGDGFIGGALVLTGALFADNFETATTGQWSSVGN